MHMRARQRTQTQTRPKKGCGLSAIHDGTTATANVAEVTPSLDAVTLHIYPLIAHVKVDYFDTL